MNWGFQLINPRRLSLGEIDGASQLICACSRRSPLKGGNNLWGGGLLFFVMCVLGSRIDLDQLGDEATTQFKPMTIWRHIFLFFANELAPLFFLVWRPPGLSFSRLPAKGRGEGGTLHHNFYVWAKWCSLVIYIPLSFNNKLHSTTIGSSQIRSTLVNCFLLLVYCRQWWTKCLAWWGDWDKLVALLPSKWKDGFTTTS